MSKYISITLVCFFAIYLLYAFVQAEIDPFQWKQYSRAGMAFLSAFVSIVANVFKLTYDIFDNQNK